MSTHAIAFRPPDAKWKKMKRIYDACNEAGIDIPDEVSEFFNHEAPDESGVEVQIEDTAATEWNDDSRSGFEIDITKLPKDVHIVRVYNSW